MTASQTCS